MATDTSGRIGGDPPFDFNGSINYSSTPNHPVTVIDARHREGRLAASDGDGEEALFRGCGFLLAEHVSAVIDWTDHDEVKAKYYDESHQLVQRLLPSFNVQRASSHIYRAEDVTEDTTLEQRPAPYAHNDYGDDVDEGGAVVNRWCDLGNISDRDRRVIGINLWRSVSEKPLARMPLAVLDRRTIDRDAMVYMKNPGLHAIGNASSLPPSEVHEWCYYPHMTRDEVLVFLTYDSDPPASDLFGNKGAPFTPTMHTAVDIPGTDHLHQRQSVEMRFFANAPLGRRP